MHSRTLIRTLARSTLGPLLESAVSLYHSMTTRRSNSAAYDLDLDHTRLPFPVDAVYTWVDDSDPDWRERKDYHARKAGGSLSATARHSTRFHNREELRYSLRSVAKYAPFIRDIYIVTDDQTPDWLNTNNPQITVVPHTEIFPTDALPTFNSHAIEARLHHIPHLSEHYIYFNDDVFFGKPANPFDFFTPDGLSIGYLSKETVDQSEASTADTDLVWTLKNNRDLIQHTFGENIQNKLAHVPHSQIRSTLFEMEKLYEPRFTRTTYSRFRSIHDISVASSLYHYYASFSGKGLLRHLSRRSPFRCRYINTASPWLRPVLRSLCYSRTYQVFCINEPMAVIDTTPFDPIVATFLDTYYPEKCVFEL